jgi:hypothetical protein
MKLPPELFVVVFPCGAWEARRGRDAAMVVAGRIAKEGTCCGKGHVSFEIQRYAPSGTWESCPRSKPNLRLVR